MREFSLFLFHQFQKKTVKMEILRQKIQKLKKALVENILSWRRISIFVVFLPNLRNKNFPLRETRIPPTGKTNLVPCFPFWWWWLQRTCCALVLGWLAGCLLDSCWAHKFWLIGNTLTRSHAVAIKHTLWFCGCGWLVVGWLAGWLVGGDLLLCCSCRSCYCRWILFIQVVAAGRLVGWVDGWGG